MNDFNYYGKLRYLEKITQQYTAGREYCTMLHDLAMEIADRIYRVAFIGEFKRGKSSLINALLGSDVLPMDTSPTTATVTRIVDGEKKICVYFKDNRVEERPLENLRDFVTKLDDEHEKMASLVREVTVSYPSVICSNKIEILDTPGLNDNEKMSRRTMEILGKIDAAVIVISAEMPMSQTEQQLILDVIKEPGIQHIIFAVTFIDRMESEEGKELIVDFIRNRISQMVRQIAKKRFCGNNDLLSKIDRILEKPDVFGVSALQARNAFQKDDKSLLKESRMPHFKEQLMVLLRKGQKESIFSKTVHAVNWVMNELPNWKSDEEKSLTNILMQKQGQIKQYKSIAQEKLIGWFQQMDMELNRKGLSSLSGLDTSCEKQLRRGFIKRLSTISLENNHHETILGLLQESRDEVRKTMISSGETLHHWVLDCMNNVEHNLSRLREESGFDTKGFDIKIANYHIAEEFPVYEWVEDPIPPYKDLKGIDLMPFINQSISASVLDFGKRINNYIGAWRVMMLAQVRNDIAEGKFETIDSSTEDAKRKLAALPFMYDQHMTSLREMLDELQN